QAVSSIIAPAYTPAEGPELVSATPSNGAAKQPLWPAQFDLLFSRPLDPTSVANNQVVMQGPNGPVAGSVEVKTNLLRLKVPAPLLPGATYTNRLLPGLKGLNGDSATLSGGVPIPATGAAFVFSTAGVGAVSPTNGTTVIAGQNVTASVSFDST